MNRVLSNPMTGVCIRKEKFEQRHTQRMKGHVRMDAEIEIMLLQAKKSQGLPATRRSWERGLEQFLPRAFSENMILPIP